MSEDLWMVQLYLDPLRLAHHGRRLPARHEDTGFEAHSLLAGLFGEGTVQPFRVQANGGRRNGDGIQVLGYSRRSLDDLRTHARDFAKPVDYAGCDWKVLAAKRMPTDWAAGRRVGFDLRACPVVRLASAREIGSQSEVVRYRPGSEIDVWLHRNFLAGGDNDSEGVREERASREEVYLDWLRDRLAPAAQLVTGRLQAFRRVRITRATHDNGRKSHIAERPDALLHGEIVVTDGRSFGELLARGIGRHRAYGFGMLLLRPPS